jgi:hypothetical protein
MPSFTALRSTPRALALVAALAVPAGAQVTAAPGWTVGAIPTPGVVQGGVLRAGTSVFVGQGAFGAGQQQVVRLDGGVATTIATGFNSLGGFALDAAGTLYVVDNGGDLTGAATGDTVFAIPSALTRATALPAVGAEVVPAGTIPAAQDVVVDGAALLVSDAAGPGAGRVVRVANGMATNLIASGLDFTAGLAIDGARLLVGNVDGAFVGAVAEYTLAGAPVGPVVGGLSGNYTHVLDADGNVLVSGGFRDDFSSSNVIAVAPGGAVSERAWGFGFSSDLFHDAARDETLVLDFGVSQITTICRDADADAACDADEPCVGGAAVAKAKLVLKKQHTPPGDDALKLVGEMAVPGPVDPAAGGARVLVADAEGTLVDAAIPPGDGWRQNPAGTVRKWVDPAGVAGIVKVVVKTPPAAPGIVRFTVVGRDGAFATSPAALPLRAAFTLESDGRCGEAAFAPEDCGFNRRGTVAKCR